MADHVAPDLILFALFLSLSGPIRELSSLFLSLFSLLAPRGLFLSFFLFFFFFFFLLFHAPNLLPSFGHRQERPTTGGQVPKVEASAFAS